MLGTIADHIAFEASSAWAPEDSKTNMGFKTQMTLPKAYAMLIRAAPMEVNLSGANGISAPQDNTAKIQLATPKTKLRRRIQAWIHHEPSNRSKVPRI